MANLNDPRLKSPSLVERLGSDTQFPIQGSFTPTNGVPLLLQDIQQLLLTLPGERVNRPEFGCTLRAEIWENIDTSAANGAAAIREAIDQYEPRVTVTSVDFTINRNTDLITYTIRFIINATDVPVNLVFPFRAGTELSFA